MAVDYGTIATAATDGANTITVTKPASTADGDILIAWLYHGDTSTAALTMSGGATWNALGSGTDGTSAAKLFWKTAGASEPASYTADITDGAPGGCLIVRATGGSGTPQFALNTTGQAGTSISTPSVTPTGNTDLVVRFVGAVAGLAVRTWTQPASHTERADVQDASQLSTFTAATRLLASGGATGTASFTASGSVSNALTATVSITGSTPQTVTTSGVASAEAFGTTQLNLTIAGSGIASGEAFGTTIVATPEPLTISPSGIASGEAFGALTTRRYVGVSGIASGEAFGSARLAALIGPTGIPSGEAFGVTNVAIEQFITPAGLVSGEAFGFTNIQVGYPQTIFPDGIESGELVEDPFLRNADRLVLVPPSVQETPAAWSEPFMRFGIDRGITIMKSAGVWRLVRYPAQTEVESAERAYLGGRRHTITIEEANDLIGAGYGAYILLEPDD